MDMDAQYFDSAVRLTRRVERGPFTLSHSLLDAPIPNYILIISCTAQDKVERIETVAESFSIYPDRPYRYRQKRGIGIIADSRWINRTSSLETPFWIAYKLDLRLIHHVFGELHKAGESRRRYVVHLNLTSSKLPAPTNTVQQL